MKSFEDIMLHFPDKHILVVGDVMLDRFIYGEVKRISPEAPAAVLTAGKPQDALGGAANAALNVMNLGAGCDLLGVVGPDDACGTLSRMLSESGIHAPLTSIGGRHTTVKMRFVANLHNTHLLRADWEDSEPIDQQSEQALLAQFCTLLPRADAIILSDYNKGVLTNHVLSTIIKMVDHKKPIVVDPKGNDFSRYRGVTALSPNVAEIRAAVGHAVKDESGPLIEAARYLIDQAQCEALLLTRSEKGVLVVERSGDYASFPATAKRVLDVSGAGDTLVASFAVALAAGASPRHAAQLANAAAGIAVAKPGTSVVTRSELRDVLLSRPSFESISKIFTNLDDLKKQIYQWRHGGLTIGFTNGCFDLLHPGHIYLLHNARLHCDRLIVGINSDASVRRLKGPARPVQDETARATVMSALAFVDSVVVFDEDTPLQIIDFIKPDVLIKGADYTIDQVVGRNIIEARGGRVVLVDLVPDRSTTSIVNSISVGQAYPSGEDHLVGASGAYETALVSPSDDRL